MSEPTDLDLKAFPSTRYQGSKRKIVPWLWEIFGRIEFDSALDLFGGSAMVSYLLKRMGKRVCYNDLLHCNYLTAVALIQNDSVKLADSFEVAKPTPAQSERYRIVKDWFKGFYFTDYENAWIDRAVSTLESIGGSGPEAFYQKAIGYHALFQACLVKRPFNLFHRKNLYIRTADVKRSFGNKTTWDTPISQMFTRFVNEANESVFGGKQQCAAHNYDARSFPTIDYDLVYFDFPYVTKRKKVETSDYLTIYHFLEGLSKYHEWPSRIDKESPLRAVKATDTNPFTSAETNLPALRELFQRFEKSTLVISYKKYGTPSVSWFISEFKRLGKKVRCATRHYKYALNNQNGDAARNREIVIVAS